MNGREYSPSAEDKSKFRIQNCGKCGEIIYVHSKSMKHFIEETFIYSLQIADSKSCRILNAGREFIAYGMIVLYFKMCIVISCRVNTSLSWVIMWL
jgi:hypothetical protein